MYWGPMKPKATLTTICPIDNRGLGGRLLGLQTKRWRLTGGLGAIPARLSTKRIGLYRLQWPNMGLTKAFFVSNKPVKCSRPREVSCPLFLPNTNLELQARTT